MATLWQKTLFYLGLVDEDEAEAPVEPPPQQARVRTVEPPRSRTSRMSQPAQPAQPSAPQAPANQGMGYSSSGVSGRRVEPPARQRRRVSDVPEHAEAGVLVRGPQETLAPRPVAAPAETEIIEARSFTDAQALADYIRDDTAVVLDLRGTEPAMVRRLVDFATGLTYALEGRMAKIAQGVILVTPQGVSLSVDEQQRLAELGLYTVNR